MLTFTKFYRIDSTREGGPVLGLSIVKGLVEAHKGTIAVWQETWPGNDTSLPAQGRVGIRVH